MPSTTLRMGPFTGEDTCKGSAPMPLKSQFKPTEATSAGTSVGWSVRGSERFAKNDSKLDWTPCFHFDGFGPRRAPGSILKFPPTLQVSPRSHRRAEHARPEMSGTLPARDRDTEKV